MKTESRPVEVSVIIPAYGRPLYLRELLSSILAEGTASLEVLVIDDGSPQDIASAIADEFCDAPVTFVRQANAGVAAARNAGAALATGEFLLFVDDDDLVPAGSIRWRTEFLQSSPQYSAVSGRCDFIRDGLVVETEPVRWRGALTHWDTLIHNRFYSPGQVLFRRSAFERTEGCRLDCIGSDDWALWNDLTRIAPIFCDARIALGYRMHGGNFSRNIATMCYGAERVADAAIATLCSRHSAVANALATGFVSSVYAPKLARAMRGALQARAWDASSEIAVASARLYGRTLATRVGRKMALVRHHGRWRMGADEMEMLGRGCADCAALGHGDIHLHQQASPMHVTT